jgi:hypothetical protein
MKRERVSEIISVYGGFPVAWPPEERAVAEALVAGDSGLRAEMHAAQALDRMLTDWARSPFPVSDADADAAAVRALGVPVEPNRRSGWLFPGALVGGAVAASLALAAVLLRPGPAATPTVVATAGDPAGVELALNELGDEQAGAADDMLVWASVFTPTPEEESVI